MITYLYYLKLSYKNLPKLEHIDTYKQIIKFKNDQNRPEIYNTSLIQFRREFYFTQELIQLENPVVYNRFTEIC